MQKIVLIINWLAFKRAKTVKDSNLVWVDCEMTGLDPNKDHLLEIAVIVTDKDLNVLAEGPNLVIHQSDEVWNHEFLSLSKACLSF